LKVYTDRPADGLSSNNDSDRDLPKDKEDWDLWCEKSCWLQAESYGKNTLKKKIVIGQNTLDNTLSKSKTNHTPCSYYII
jgi:hypothetical protein